ncbi:MAG: FG-GAP repeat domain-containing protein, partial [Thermomicrobiales bacterium]
MRRLDRHGRSRSHRHIWQYALLIGGVLLLAWPTSLTYAVSPVTFIYTSAANAPVGIGPDATAVADLNGDGKQDLVVANHKNNTVSVLLGKGDGTFAPGSPITVGAGPVALVLADLNNDGKQDLVVANQDSNSVSVLLGNGNGAFTPVGAPIPTARPSDVAVGDLNNDSKIDLVIKNTSNTVSVLLGNGNGAFT